MDQLTAPKETFPTPCSSSQVEAGNQLVGKMPFLLQKAPLYSEGVAATLSGNGIQPKVMLREVADPWLICSFSEELCREDTQLHGKQEEWQYFIGKSNPRETQVPPGGARAACSVAASISRNFVAKRKKKKEYSTICFYFWSCLCTRQLTSATCSPFAQRMFSLPSSPLFPFPRQFFLPISAWFTEEMHSFIVVSLCIAL